MIHGIVLAAGRSSRMGKPKALLPAGTEGQLFLGRIVASLRSGGVSEIAVVTGADADAIRAHVAEQRLPVRLVHNAEHDMGQLSSLKAGLSAIAGPDVSAAMVTLVDIPFFDQNTVRLLIEAHRAHHPLIVRPVNDGRHGHPVLFNRRLFDELLGADPAEGAKPVVHAHLDEIVEVPVNDEGAFLDVDTMDDYERILRSLLR